MTDEEAERKRINAAWRQMKKRALKKLDWMPVGLYVKREFRDLLIDAGHLAEWDENNPEAVAAAIDRLHESLKSVTVTP